ncbi:unnamed protein product [Alternaria burnsii]|nr:unnamed protein product [Alternaria burnsii]
MTQNTKTADQSLMYTIGRPSSNFLYNDRKDSLTNHSDIQNNVVVTNIIRTDPCNHEHLGKDDEIADRGSEEKNKGSV